MLVGETGKQTNSVNADVNEKWKESTRVKSYGQSLEGLFTGGVQGEPVSGGHR